MLIRELSKSTNIVARDLIKTPVGAICYIFDCLHTGYSIADVCLKINNYNKDDMNLPEMFYNTNLLDKLMSVYSEIKSLADVLIVDEQVEDGYCREDQENV